MNHKKENKKQNWFGEKQKREKIKILRCDIFLFVFLFIEKDFLFLLFRNHRGGEEPSSRWSSLERCSQQANFHRRGSYLRRQIAGRRP